VQIGHCLNSAAVDELFKGREGLSITNCSLSCISWDGHLVGKMQLGSLVVVLVLVVAGGDLN
jgi:hypothetical protein